MGTYGHYLLNKALPDEYKIHGPATKGVLRKKMDDLARKDPALYSKVIMDVKQMGDRVATLEGLSIGLDDITPQYKDRAARMQPFRKRFRQARDDGQRESIVVQAQSALENLVTKHPGTLTLQVSSGARGNQVQYTNMVGGLGYARDAKGSVTPWLIEKSYAEGLGPADYWATTNQSVVDLIKTQTSVSEPGELAKKLVNSMSDLVVTEDDCGTTDGIRVTTESVDAIDRYVAEDTGSIKRNTLITPLNQPKFARMARSILVRSPMTCEAMDGVCQRCQGLDEKGNMHIKGINVGVRSAQAMAEPLTQFALNAKHGGRTLASDKNQVHGIQGFRQVIESPNVFNNKATLASKDGVIDRIEDAPQGGYEVYIGNNNHYVTPGLALKVSKGDKVFAGDVLSEGIPKPDEVVRYKGLGEGRLYVVNTLRNLYKGQGKDLDQRHFELLAKSSMNHVRVLRDPTNTFIKGDVINYNNLRAELKRDAKLVKLKDAAGETLGMAYHPFAVGTRITERVLKDLSDRGIREVLIARRSPDIEFIMKSATGIPKLHKDWIGRMAHQGLKRSVMQAAAFGESSNIHGTHPVPAYIYGAEFGEGSDGRY